MRRPKPTFPILPTGQGPLHERVYDAVRAAILGRRLRPGDRLPATRAAAAELGVSRTTVLWAFERLRAEGYLDGRPGSGTFVAASIPDETTHTPRTGGTIRTARALDAVCGRAAELITIAHLDQLEGSGGPPRAFALGQPAFDAFPAQLWGRLLGRHWRRAAADLHGYRHPAGYLPLRQAIAGYLTSARGVRCSVDQIIVTAGSQQGLALTAQVLLGPGDPVWVEDPGYPGTRGAIIAAGGRPIPVPVDDQGLDVAAGEARCPDARLAVVTPSRQFPLGATMGLPRRLELLAWANRVRGWVVEDDYDSEFRYVGRPLPALQGLDGTGRVVYLGTFSKVMFPALRLGYLVAPPGLEGAFAAAKLFADAQSPLLEQAALAEFIGDGHFIRHVRRTRRLYAARQAALVGAARTWLGGLLDVQPAEAGMHLVGWLRAGIDDEAVSRRARAFGVEVRPVSQYSSERMPGGLVLGYAGVNEAEILSAVRQIAAAISPLG